MHSIPLLASCKLGGLINMTIARTVPRKLNLKGRAFLHKW